MQFVPDADLLGSGSVVINAQGYYYQDITDGTRIVPLGFVNYGIIEWVNIEAGYAGGASLGLKARILGETRPWMPSVAIGARNIFSHREAYLFGREPDSIENDFYIVGAKSFEAARLRFHLGLQSIPNNDNEKFSFFAAIEKYLGNGVYLSVEAFYREKNVHPSLFAAWRFLKKRFELSIGMIDITRMFIDREGIPSNSAFYESNDSRFVRPGIWVGLRFNTKLKVGKTGGFTGIENSLSDHSASINTLRNEVDSLKQLLSRSSNSIETLNKTLIKITDSSQTDAQRYKTLAIEKLALLGTLYTAEPFEPDAVNNTMAELIANRDSMLPALYDIIIDPVQQSKIRCLAITALGEIGTSAAADVVIGFLGQSTIPELTIECLIALGKMKETRAIYLMQQLANDPNDDVAFTAAEVLQKLEKETGISTVPISEAKVAPVSIPEKSLGGEDKPPSITDLPAKENDSHAISTVTEESTPFTKIEETNFDVSTVSKEPVQEFENDSAAAPSDTTATLQTVPPATMVPTIASPDEARAVASTPDVDSNSAAAKGAIADSRSIVHKENTLPADNKMEAKGGTKTKPKTKRTVDTSSDNW